MVFGEPGSRQLHKKPEHRYFSVWYSNKLMPWPNAGGHFDGLPANQPSAFVNPAAQATISLKGLLHQLSVRLPT
jgi:hypothetical protein